MCFKGSNCHYLPLKFIWHLQYLYTTHGQLFPDCSLQQLYDIFCLASLYGGLTKMFGLLRMVSTTHQNTVEIQFPQHTPILMLPCCIRTSCTLQILHQSNNVVTQTCTHKYTHVRVRARAHTHTHTQTHTHTNKSCLWASDHFQDDTQLTKHKVYCINFSFILYTNVQNNIKTMDF